VLLLSEKLGQALVLTVYQDDGCDRSQDVAELQWSPPAGYSPDSRFRADRTNNKKHPGNGKPGIRHARPSTSRTTPRTRLPKRRLARVPTLDLRSQPEARTSAAEVEDWPRHVLVAAHVEAHRIAVGEPEDPRDVMRVDEVFEGYAPGHLASLAALPEVLSTRVINSVRTSM
jgi:hypothetical protein